MSMASSESSILSIFVRYSLVSATCLLASSFFVNSRSSIVEETPFDGLDLVFIGLT